MVPKRVIRVGRGRIEIGSHDELRATLRPATGLLVRARDAPVTSGTVRFTLSNRQRDEYPVSMTVKAKEAMAALEHFFGMSELTPFLERSPAP